MVRRGKQRPSWKFLRESILVKDAFYHGPPTKRMVGGLCRGRGRGGRGTQKTCLPGRICTGGTQRDDARDPLSCGGQA
jgi:hypothetical protein